MWLTKGRVAGFGLYGVLLGLTAWASSFGCQAGAPVDNTPKPPPEYKPLVIPVNRPWKCADCHEGKATPSALDSAVTKKDEFPPNCAKCSEAAKRVVPSKGVRAPGERAPGY